MFCLFLLLLLFPSLFFFFFLIWSQVQSEATLSFCLCIVDRGFSRLLADFGSVPGSVASLYAPALGSIPRAWEQEGLNLQHLGLKFLKTAAASGRGRGTSNSGDRKAAAVLGPARLPQRNFCKNAAGPGLISRAQACGFLALATPL